jgi:hypothetical protein
MNYNFKNIIKGIIKTVLDDTETFKREIKRVDIEKNKRQKEENTKIPIKKSEKNILPKRKEFKIPDKVWKKGYKPQRSIVLFGIDKDNNPGFIIFYGEHNFENAGDFENEYEYGTKYRYILKDEVAYTSYVLFRGKNGHFPSLKKVKIIDGDYYRKEPYMIYNSTKTDYWYSRNKKTHEEFFNLKDKVLKINYFKETSYSEYVEKVKEMNLDLKGFKIVENPLEFLGGKSELNYIIFDILKSQDVYKRKKLMDEYIEKNPKKDIIENLFEKMSCDMLSGIFLNLAQNSNKILIDKANKILNEDLNWDEENSVKGLKRCAKLYINSIDENKKKERIEWLKSSLKNFDLHLTNLNGKKFSEDNILEGAQYRKFSNQGYFREFNYRYDSKTKKYIKTPVEDRYIESPYNDKKNFNIIELKNTLEEAQIYNMANEIGEIAYYFDSPRIKYYFEGIGKNKAYKYFLRKIRRTIDLFSIKDEKLFMQIMKSLLTKYTDKDYLCKFKGNFQFNYFIKYYLYNDFKEKTPSAYGDYSSWLIRRRYLANDQLLKLEGRYEFKKEIWDKNLDIVIQIASKSKIEDILKACYFIIKDEKNFNKIKNELSFKEIIELTENSYEPLKNIFKELLINKINDLKDFDPDLMINLMGTSNDGIHKIATDYFKEKNGYFSPYMVSGFLKLSNIETLTEIFKSNLEGFQNQEYLEFVKSVFDLSVEFTKNKIELPDNILELILNTGNKLESLDNENEQKLLRMIIEFIIQNKKLTNWMYSFIEELLFTNDFDKLYNLIKKDSGNFEYKVLRSRNKKIISLLKAVRFDEIIEDSEIIDIIENSNSKVISILTNLIIKNKKLLVDRYSTLIIMFESPIIILNNIAEEIFDSFEDRNKKLHLLLVDSPVERAYKKGIEKIESIYKDTIPKEFIIQLMEHGSQFIKSYISNKIDNIINDFDNGNDELFMYYIKTLLYMPNKNSKSKDRIYKILPGFVYEYPKRIDEVEAMLLDIGASNIIIDSERALVALAKIKTGGELNAG